MTKNTVLAAIVVLMGLAAGAAFAASPLAVDIFGDSQCVSPRNVMKYELLATAGDTVIIDIAGRKETDDWNLNIYDLSGRLIQSDANPSTNAFATFTAAKTESFTVEVINNTADPSCFDMNVTWL